MTNDTLTLSRFSEFPIFTKLTLEDKPAYDRFISQFPPVDDTSFTSLMSWWNSFGNIAVSRHGNNLVVPYWIPGVESASGMSVVGTDHVDQTLCAVMDHLRERGEPVRLVQVSDFTVAALHHPEIFHITPMPEFDEYVVPSDHLTDPSKFTEPRRIRTTSADKRLTGRTVEIRPFDLTSGSDRKLVSQALEQWSRDAKGNEFSTYSDQNIRTLMEHGDSIGIRNLSLFVDGKLQAFVFFYLSNGGANVNIQNLRTSSEYPHMFDYAAYRFAKELAEEGVMFFNVVCDFGLQPLRALKLSLQPSHYYRKFMIEPAAGSPGVLR